jgi:hypothetical protein
MCSTPALFHPDIAYTHEHTIAEQAVTEYAIEDKHGLEILILDILMVMC